MPSLLWLPPPSSASPPDSSSDHSPSSSSSPQQPEQCIYWRMKLNWIQLWLSINCYWIVDYNRLILKKCNFTVQSMEMHWLFWKRFIELLLRYLELMNISLLLPSKQSLYLLSLLDVLHVPDGGGWARSVLLWFLRILHHHLNLHWPSGCLLLLVLLHTLLHDDQCLGLGCHQELRLCSVLISLIRDQ